MHFVFLKIIIRYVDMSKNYFDDRVMRRLRDLLDADLNDPIVRF